MNLKNKAFIITALSTLLFVVCAYFIYITHSIQILTIFSIFFLISIGYLINKYFIKPNQNKDQEIKELIQKNEEYAQIMKKKELEQKQLQQMQLDHQLSSGSTEFTSQEYLNQVARYDDITSLPNRVFYNEILNKAINHAKRHKKIIGILVIQIDTLPSLKKSLDKNNVNAILKEMSKRFSDTLRKEDILAKSEEDEYFVLLNDIVKSKFAGRVAEKLLRVASYPFKLDQEYSLTVSIGICIYPNDGESLENILTNADQALYNAQHSGGNTYHYYTQEMGLEAREYIQLESALQKALHNNELVIYFQPQLNIKRGTVTSVEALLRWEHPVLGIINPNKFIPLAEESGLIISIGEWSIRQACLAAKFWQDEGYEHIPIAVNLSPKQFYHPDIIKIITNELNQTQLNPSYLELEVNEKTVMDDLILAETILNKIKSTGVKIHLDHFGTSSTAISHLKRLPISAIKIDRSFIKGIPNKPDDSAIVSAIIALAHNLGLEVIAEGVETAEQVQFLTKHNCDMLQGYFLCHPLSSQKIVSQFNRLRDEVLS